MTRPRQFVLITGASRGFGKAAARELAHRGHAVVATMRNPERDGHSLVRGYEDRIDVTRCDVTDRTSVDAAVAFALEKHDRIDAVFNNAGYGLWGPIEEVTEAEVERQMDTNFVGQLRVAQAVLPAMREQGSGKILNVSSTSGKVVGPLLGLYSASKYAVEAMSEALRYEVARWGVQVIILEPGQYQSDWQVGSMDVTEAMREGRSLYQKSAERALEHFRERALTRPGSRTVGTIVADIVEIEQTLPMRWAIGEDSERMIAMREGTSDEQWERMIRGEVGGFRSAFFRED
jgi:NAD(P)-dependent dehydrogenase (short-subunit alcohol dehydrogenase family)